MAIIKKEPLIPIGVSLICEKCHCDMECINPDNVEEKFVYSCPKCGDTMVTDLMYPRVEYMTQDEFREDLERSGYYEKQREQLIQQAIEAGDVEMLNKLGVIVQPMFVDKNAKPS